MQRNDAASNVEIVAVIASIGAYLGRLYERRRGATVQPQAYKPPTARTYTGEQWLAVLHRASMCTMRRGLRVHTGAGWSDTMFRRRMRLFSSA